MTPEERKVKNHGYYMANREQRIADAKAHYRANLDAIKARRAAYRAANIDEMRARSRAQYQKDRVKRLAKQKEVRSTGEEKARSHGLTLGELLRMTEAQGGLCAICKQRMGRVCIDHDHERGIVRGLLCLNCNVAIGHLRDSPELLRRAAAYIESHKEPTPIQAPAKEAIA